MVDISRGWPGETADGRLPAGHDSREVAIHVPLGTPSGVPAVPVKMTLDDRKSDQLSLKCHSGWRPAIVVATA